LITGKTINACLRKCSSNSKISEFVVAPYLDTHFFSVKSQEDDLGSTFFSFHSTMFVEFLLEDRVTFFFDHRVRVTWSSTGTSLISRSEKQASLSLACVDSEWVNGGLVVGEEDLLNSGLVWVAASFLKIVGLIVVAEFSVIATCSSDQEIKQRHQVKIYGISVYITYRTIWYII
jgi:hypothetical protein